MSGFSTYTLMLHMNTNALHFPISPTCSNRCCKCCIIPPMYYVHHIFLPISKINIIITTESEFRKFSKDFLKDPVLLCNSPLFHFPLFKKSILLVIRSNWLGLTSNSAAFPFCGSHLNLAITSPHPPSTWENWNSLERRDLFSFQIPLINIYYGFPAWKLC